MLFTIPIKDEFLKKTSIKYKNIIEEFKNSKIEVMEFPWEFSHIYDILNVYKNKIPLFETISDNLNCDKTYTILSIGISVLKPQNKPAPHFDLHAHIKGFKRLHLPLQLTDTSFLYVMEGCEYEKYSWELGQWAQFVEIDKLHYPLNEDKDGTSRIIMIMDVVEGGIDDKGLYEYYEVIENLGARLNHIDFRPHYEKYILNKNNK